MELITGVARIDVRTKNLIPRLKSGEIAIIDHQDLDGLSASGLAERQVAAVINAGKCISGRYPNRGPSVLLQNGIPLFEAQDSRIMSAVSEGDTLTVEEGRIVWRNGEVACVRLTEEYVEEALFAARQSLGAEIEKFARNTLEYIERERSLVVDILDLPAVRTRLAHRHAVLVTRGDGFKRDLAAIHPYLRDMRPVLIAVDGGADALLEVGLKPDMIVGDMDSVSDDALLCGAEIVVHSYPSHNDLVGLEPCECHCTQKANGEIVKTVPGMDRLKSLGLEALVFSVAGTSEDMAMLLAYEMGADVIVSVGSHFGLEDFLDKGRAGMASTFLVRLRVGSRLVDAKGVGALYPTGPGLEYAWRLLLAAAFVPVLIMALLSPVLRSSITLGYIVLSHWLRAHGA